MKLQVRIWRLSKILLNNSCFRLSCLRNYNNSNTAKDTVTVSPDDLREFYCQRRVYRSLPKHQSYSDWSWQITERATQRCTWSNFQERFRKTSTSNIFLKKSPHNGTMVIANRKHFFLGSGRSSVWTDPNVKWRLLKSLKRTISNNSQHQN